MAVYLATSDEAIPLLVSMPAYWDKLAVLIVNDKIVNEYGYYRF